MPSPVTMLVSKLVEMSLDKQQLEKKLKIHKQENEELKQQTVIVMRKKIIESLNVQFA